MSFIRNAAENVGEGIKNVANKVGEKTAKGVESLTKGVMNAVIGTRHAREYRTRIGWYGGGKTKRYRKYKSKTKTKAYRRRR